VAWLHDFDLFCIVFVVNSKFVNLHHREATVVLSADCAFVLMSEDVLTEDKGECVICLDDLQQGDVIARLPCLCIYHKRYLNYRWIFLTLPLASSAFRSQLIEL